MNSKRTFNGRPCIAVLFGGCSPEYEVSLQSAYAVISSIDTEKYTPVLIGITKWGDWYRFDGEPQKIINDTWFEPDCCEPVAVSPNRSEHMLICFSDSAASNGVPDRRGSFGAIKKIPVDAAFPVLHGKNGEDGTVQGIFETAGIPVAGCGVLSSALCMDKVRAHKLAETAGVSVPLSFAADKRTSPEELFACAAKTGYPLFVKPVKAGSSFGITKVYAPDELLSAVKTAFEYDDRVIIEENINGFEVGCAIMGSSSLTVGEVDEIELENGFFDYTEKYTLKTSAIHVPARVDAATAERIKQAAVTVYLALDCRGFARVDMFLTPSGDIVFNEVNTVPGFTSHSRFPNMLKAVGMSFEAVVNTAIENALKQADEK